MTLPRPPAPEDLRALANKVLHALEVTGQFIAARGGDAELLLWALGVAEGAFDRRVEALRRRNLTSAAAQRTFYVAMLFGHPRPIGVYSTAALAVAALRAHPDYPGDSCPGDVDNAKAASYVAVHTLDGGPVMEAL